MTDIVYTQELVTTSCYCGIEFAIPKSLKKWMLQDERNGCHCPNGHSMHFGNGELQRLRSEVERTKQRNVHLQDQRDAAERSLTAQKGVNTKLKKRAANGVCPCCNRSFVQLARHMTTKHPDFVGQID